MMQENKQWPGTFGRVLCILGALPFVLALIAAALPFGLMLWPFMAVLVSTYTGLIITFIAGSHWGFSQKMSVKPAKRVMLLSNLLVIFIWLGILFPIWVFSWLLLLVGLWLGFALDRYLFSHQVIEKPYLMFRFKMTLAVSFAILTLAFLGRNAMW
jgi:hypothetical protein